MKRIFLSALIGVGMVAAIFSTLSGSEAALTQQSYPLVCRGSANLEIGVAPGDGSIGFVFTRGTKPAGEGLGPGECSWVDRGMRDDEPDRLSQHVSSKAGPNLPYEGPTLLPIHTKPWSELHSPDKYWTFMVYNDRQGQLIVTGARPSVPAEIKPTPRATPDLSELKVGDDLTISTPGVYSEDGNLYVALPITNVGAAPALRVQIESIHAVRYGSGRLLTPATLPAVMGDIEPGGRRVLDASFDASFLLPNERGPIFIVAPRTVLTLKGSYSINNQTRRFTLNKVLNIPQASNAARTTEDYPLVCRGGGSLVTGIAPGERNIGFTFVRGTKPAGEGLAPGECSWKDRGMYADEPDRVSQHVEEGSESLKVGGTLAPENRWYEELHSSSKYWTFMVSNNGRGQLIATSARPNKQVEVSTTARVPSTIGQVLRRDLPRVHIPDDEMPKIIVLSGPEDASSRTEMLKRFPAERNMNVMPAPQALSIEEKIGLLKSTGLKTLDETPTPYVTFTPRQPYVAGRGYLRFWYPASVSPDTNELSFPVAPKGGLVSVALNFETTGVYLMTLTVSSYSYSLKKSAEWEPPKFAVFAAADGSTQTFLGKKNKAFGPREWQHLNVIVEAPKPGDYHFLLEFDGRPEDDYAWVFSSCDVTMWRK